VKNKGLVGLVIIGLVMAITWALGTAIMVQALHGKDAFTIWRQHHFWLYVMIWLGAVIVITIPILYAVGTHMAKAMGESEEALARSKGVGRLAMQALQGRESAIESSSFCSRTLTRWSAISRFEPLRCSTTKT